MIGGVMLRGTRDKTMRMHTKILWVCMFCTFTALILQTLLFRYTSSEIIYDWSKEESFNSLENMQDDVYSFVKEIESGLISVYNEREFILDLQHETGIEELREDYYREAYHIATEGFDTQSEVVAMYLYNMDHEIISTYRRATTPKHNYPEDIYEQGVDVNAEKVREYVESDEATMLISSYYNIYREKDILRFVLKIYGNNGREQKIGYIVCDIDTKVLQYMMKKYIISDDMFLWLQPQGDRPVFSIGSDSEDVQESYMRLSNQIWNGTEGEPESDLRENQILFQVKQDKYNLVACSLLPQVILEENQKQLTRNLLLISAIMFILTTVLSSVVSGTLTKPLEALTDMTKRIKGGETDLRIADVRKDEIGELGQSFNEMLDQIQELVSKQYETKLLLNKAKYNALQAQINPHFLYNTLDTMSSIAQIKGCQEVSALSQSLSNVFRYSLDMKNPLSTVEKEIIHLKNYIYVVNVRMNDAVKYEFDIAEDALEDSIPRITLQPIVENAVNHGLRNSHREKRVKIEAYHEDKNLIIKVWDNGVGMAEEVCRDLLADKSYEAVEQEKSTSIGLRNINARMKMLYGEEYGLGIESCQDEGTCVTLTIPGISIEEVKNGGVQI